MSWRHYAVLSLLHWTIFSQARPLLVTKINPAGPVFVDQKWFSQATFSSINSLAEPFYPDHFFCDSLKEACDKISKNHTVLADLGSSIILGFPYT